MATSPPKMKDVAALAGVSIKTVSRVLNNEPHVQPSVRDRVRDAADTLKYIPSKSARSLRGNKSYCINLLCHSARSSYVNAIQFGAIIACQELGYQLTISLAEDLDKLSQKKIATTLESLFSGGQKPDGVLLAAQMATDKKVAKALNDLNIPAARIGPTRIRDGAALVEINDHLAAREMTEYILSLEHTRIGFIRGKEEQLATEERFQGYKAALEAAGIEVDPNLVRSGRFDFKSGLEAANALLDLDVPPTAIFAANDDMAAGALMAATQRGMNVPKDLSVAGFDDAEIAQTMWPTLTTVRQPLEDLGAIAIRNLISVMGVSSETVPSTMTLPHEVVIRDSTARLAR